VEQARPRIELPAPSRRDEARDLAAKWHNKVIRHTTKSFERYGRITFTEPEAKRWFRIFWNDGPERESLHDKRILARLEVIPPEEAPDDIIPEAPPVKVWVMREASEWSIQTHEDILKRLQQGMPGTHSVHDINVVHRAIQSLGKRRELVVRQPPELVDLLNTTLDLTTCNVILDPWAGARVIAKDLHVGNARLCLNEKLGCKGVHLMLEPLEARLYAYVKATFGRLDAIVMCPPASLADFAFINALQFAGRITCMLVPDAWLLSAHASRRALLSQLASEDCIFYIVDMDPACKHCWVCVLADKLDRNRFFKPGMDPGEGDTVFLQRKTS
jgi:hypothetical protein